MLLTMSFLCEHFCIQEVTQHGRGLGLKLSPDILYTLLSCHCLHVFVVCCPCPGRQSALVMMTGPSAADSSGTVNC